MEIEDIPWDAKSALITHLQARDAPITSMREAVIVFGTFPVAQRRMLNVFCEERVFGKHLLTWMEIDPLLECISHEYPYDVGEPLG